MTKKDSPFSPLVPTLFQGWNKPEIALAGSQSKHVS